MGVRIEQVSASATWGLRQAVLRPHESVGELRFPSDDLPTTGSFAAVTDDGEVVSTVQVALERPLLGIDAGSPLLPAWRLRGMATRGDLRGRGIGTEVLGRAVRHVAGHGGGLLWCNARVPAQNLYLRSGFVKEGDPWEEPGIGPHIVMWRLVTPADGPTPEAS